MGTGRTDRPPPVPVETAAEFGVFALRRSRRGDEPPPVTYEPATPGIVEGPVIAAAGPAGGSEHEPQRRRKESGPWPGSQTSQQRGRPKPERLAAWVTMEQLFSRRGKTQPPGTASKRAGDPPAPTSTPSRAEHPCLERTAPPGLVLTARRSGWLCLARQVVARGDRNGNLSPCVLPAPSFTSPVHVEYDARGSSRGVRVYGCLKRPRHGRREAGPRPNAHYEVPIPNRWESGRSGPTDLATG